MPQLLDINGNGTITFAQDALLINAYLFFKQSDIPVSEIANKLDDIVSIQAGSTRNGQQVYDWITSNLYSLLDIDGSGNLPTYSTDGALISAYLFFYPIDTPADFDAIDKHSNSPYATRDTNQIITYLDTLYNTVI